MNGNEYLYMKRMEKGLSSRELAAMCGLSHTQIMVLEKGKHEVSFKNLIKILDALDISLYQFVRAIGYFPPAYIKENDGLVAGGGFEPPTTCNAALAASS
ncbi:helix-turn-helix domain-containing protein [Candidatus Magnetominusculus dajiuhuensis]|uniref:helix-turn-helix domain-containing protein n=1 Tax=Candidatus Magnetominusculus dajiuhuensis TaxID=3137712 RepID=UPI003B431011